MTRNIELTYTFGRDKLTEKAKHLAEGALLLLGQEGQVNTPPATVASLRLNESYADGRKNSAQGVWFADLDTSTPDGEMVVSRPVAIKPVGPAWLAAREVRQAEEINSIGNDNYPDMAPSPITFVPIGLMNTGGRISTVTAFESAVTSFDNVVWPSESATPPSERAIQAALSYSAISIIFLHANQYVHGDAQAKNTAFDGTSSRIVDITTMKKRPNMRDKYMEYVDDLSTFSESVAKHKSFNGITTEQLEAWFIEPYQSCVADMYPTDAHDRTHQSIAQVLREYDAKS